jgi:ectoine hydroxylase-related dioxygenase (phytanoyl-CoA dioxygenase family)
VKTDLGIHNSESRSQNLESIDLAPFERNGFQIIRAAVGAKECESLASELTILFNELQKSSTSRVAGVRNLLLVNKHVAEFARSPTVLGLLEKAIAARPFPVRAMFFDKNPGSNWLVPWHQDLAIPVAERIETPGFHAWSIKDSVRHVHPPQFILEGMITLRLHLDDCSCENGALRVVPGSHRFGKFAPAKISQMDKSNEVVCEVAKGGILVMRPLLLHASPTANNPSHRRVLHIEYATQALPNGLQWLGN